MAHIPFIHDSKMNPGQADTVSPMVRRVLAGNPGPFTYTGTQTFIIGHGSLAVIDPGPADQTHIDAILAATKGETITHILVTHTHMDHSPAARPLAEITGATIFAYGPHGSGREGGMADEIVEAGADKDFAPDQNIPSGERISGGTAESPWTFEAIHTPGHTSNHMCFYLEEEETLFTGDHIMGWSTTIVSPPDGDMALYMDSLQALLMRGDKILRPTHGPAIIEPQLFIESLIAHRIDREDMVIAAVKGGKNNVQDIVSHIYSDVPKEMHPAAARSCLSHLIVLAGDGRIKCNGAPTLESNYWVE